MPKHLNSFVLRCWRLADGGQRIEVEHIQSGEKRLTHSPGEAVEWVCVRSDDAGHATPATPGERAPQRAEPER